ncbi:RF-1 domain-containing protein [Gaertneriomyces semiglobifer]|nr:RF-1 domain-containing protein [Gaertneriomyces semiglobifer]
MRSWPLPLGRLLRLPIQLQRPPFKAIPHPVALRWCQQPLHAPTARNTAETADVDEIDTKVEEPVPLGTPKDVPIAKKPRDRIKEPVILLETDLEESFVKGSGPGGQKINKCRHRVQLKHIPTGITAESQRFRELAANRKEARKLLKLKLDELINGDLSRKQQQIAKQQKRKAKQAQRAKKKYGSPAELENGDDGATTEGDGPVLNELESLRDPKDPSPLASQSPTDRTT